MTYTEKRFEDYLETICFEANPSVLDDDMPDFFDSWLGSQDVEDMGGGGVAGTGGAGGAGTGGAGGAGTGGAGGAWFVWEKGYVGKPSIEWI